MEHTTGVREFESCWMCGKNPTGLVIRSASSEGEYWSEEHTGLCCPLADEQGEREGSYLAFPTSLASFALSEAERGGSIPEHCSNAILLLVSIRNKPECWGNKQKLLSF